MPQPVPDLKYWQEDLVKLSISKLGTFEPLNAQRILPFNTFQKVRFLLGWLTVQLIDIEQTYYKTERRAVFHQTDIGAYTALVNKNLRLEETMPKMVKKSVLWQLQISNATYRRSLDVHLQIESRNYKVAKLDDDLYRMKVSLNDCRMDIPPKVMEFHIRQMEERMKDKRIDLQASAMIGKM